KDGARTSVTSPQAPRIRKRKSLARSTTAESPRPQQEERKQVMADSNTTHTIGRRKEARCRLYLKPGSGKWQVNGRTLGGYFPPFAPPAANHTPHAHNDSTR